MLWIEAVCFLVAMVIVGVIGMFVSEYIFAKRHEANEDESKRTDNEQREAD